MEIEARDYKNSDFATLINLRPAHLSDILHEKRNLSASLAIRLETILGVEAEFWLRIQTSYDLALEPKKIKDA